MAEIAITKGLTVLVDEADLPHLIERRWSAHLHGRYAANGKLTMHRYLMGHPPFKGAQVDHINGNGLDNRRANLRWASASTNKANEGKRRGNFTSKFKGVHWNRQKNKWKTEIKLNYKKKHLGFFLCEIDAAKAYDKAAVEIFGEFAKLNFSKDE